MKGLVALVVVLSLGYVGVRQFERAEEIVLDVPASYAAAQTVQLSSQRDLFAELEMKLPPGLGVNEEGAVPAAPEVAVAEPEKSFVSSDLKRRKKRGHHSRSRRHRRHRR